MSQSEADATSTRGTNEGSKLAGRADLWTSGALENDAEFDISGFSFSPNGIRSSTTGGYNYMGLAGSFWSSTENGSNAWKRYFDYNDTGVQRNSSPKLSGSSVRCVKD
jgi:uncharacterized protein (TIGR02145 family)